MTQTAPGHFSASPSLTVVDHPMIAHKLTLMREKATSSAVFRQRLREISQYLAYEATRDLPVEAKAIDTPMGPMEGTQIAGRKLVLVSILRAGNGLLDGFLDILPDARVGFVGLARNEVTLKAEEYYFKIPHSIEQRRVLVVDPMLATGGSASDAITHLKNAGAVNLQFCCLVAAPEGVERLSRDHPDVPILTAALDERLNDMGYIVPGLGDAGDRIYGTVDA